MKKLNSTRKTYYLPGDPTRTPLTHEVFKEIMRPFWAQKKRLQRSGECASPAWHNCLCDCCGCPYQCCGCLIDTGTLEHAGEEIRDPYCMEEDVADRIFKQQIYNCLPQLDIIDRIIIRCMVLEEKKLTERQLAALIGKAIGHSYSHQSVHKRIPAAAKRLADLMRYQY